MNNKKSSLYKPAGKPLSKWTMTKCFKEAKPGIITHLGVYAVPIFGDEWYLHWMKSSKRMKFQHPGSVPGLS